ncbi:MAG: radical SAM protein [Candidatus Paceibacterota bacterium]|jgi:radical SAM protein with 4Fe4S-binding SPASM domain|nr:radical SAM protein [bacterium]
MFNSVRLELTGDCDMQCLYCHAGEKNSVLYRKDELSHQRWLEIIAECKELGVVNFTLTGGEPFRYLRWPEIIEACGQESRVIISTNGKHFSQKNLNIISELSQVKEFRTSLDGLATNDIIREGSSYLSSIKNIKNLKSFLPGCKIMIQTVVYEQNVSELLPLYKELKETGIYCWRLSQLWKTIRTQKNSHIVNFSDYDRLFNVYVDVIKNHQLDAKPFLLRIDNVYYSWIEKEDYAPMNLSGHSCEYNFANICINANGDLIFCPALNIKYGSVKNKSIKDAIKDSDWLTDFKKITVNSLGCGNCRYIKICGGGCRATPFRWLGKINVIDPNSCCIMPRVEKVILPLLGDGERLAFSSLIDQEGTYPNINENNVKAMID